MNPKSILFFCALVVISSRLLADDTLDNAVPIVFSGAPKQFTDRVDLADPQDIYQMALAANSALSVILSFLTGDADLELIRDKNGNGTIDPSEILASSVKGGSQNESFSAIVQQEGLYYLRVMQGGPSARTGYLLSVNGIDAIAPKPDLVRVTGIPISLVIGQSFTVTVVAENDQGVGGPDSAINASVLFASGNLSFEVNGPTGVPWANYTRLFRPGEGPVFNSNCQQTVGGAKHWLVEAGDKEWTGTESHEMSFTVTPRTSGTLIIRLRVTMRSGVRGCESFVNDSSTSGGEPGIDQQGWAVREYRVSVEENGQPDLVVSKIWTNPTKIDEQTPFSINAEISNVGKGPSPRSLVCITLDGSRQCEEWIDPLPQGGRSVVTCMIPPLRADNHTMMATADCDDSVSESNGGNNTLSGNFEIIPIDAPPDLVVSKIWTNPTKIDEQTPFSINAEISNVGKGPSPRSLVCITLDGSRQCEEWIDPLPQGGRSVVTCMIPPLRAGNHTMMATADCDDSVSESNGGNNTLSAEIEIGTGRPVEDDFNGDGYRDIVFEDASGFLATWSMQGSQLHSASFLNPNRVNDSNWRVFGTGDFGADRKTDLSFQHADGSLAVWLMDGITLSSGALLQPSNPGPGWRAFGTGDFDRDGKADLALQHTDGRLLVWQMNGLQLRETRTVDPQRPADARWRAVGCGDFDGDTNTDIVFQHEDGSVAIWFLAGTKLIRGESTTPKHPGDFSWHVVGVVDLDFNSRSDLLFQHSKSGSTAVWFMNGSRLTRAEELHPSNPGGTWRAVGPK